MPFPTRRRSPIANRCGGSAVHSSEAATSVDVRALRFPPDRFERLGHAPVDLEERVEVGDPEESGDPLPRVDENEVAVLGFQAVQPPEIPPSFSGQDYGTGTWRKASMARTVSWANFWSDHAANHPR